ncbi:hypothetical protein M1295_00110 [Patescibacteria group bacterium]|nr:hypothetical protein [Patescibacteria group bacterium]
MAGDKDKAFIFILLVAVAVLVILALVSHLYIFKTSSQTAVIRYEPTAINLPSMVESGSCFAGSIAAPYRSDAWRCSIGNNIADPCFQIKGSDELLCKPNPLNADSSPSFVMKLTGSLPEPNSVSTNVPNNWAWLVELSDGTVCTPFTGTLPFSAEGDVAYYSCDSAAANESMIFNSLDSNTTPWTAEVGFLSTSSATYPPHLGSHSTTTIKAVWQ